MVRSIRAPLCLAGMRYDARLAIEEKHDPDHYRAALTFTMYLC